MQRSSRRRLVAMLIVTMAVFLAVAVKLTQVQLVEAPRYAAFGESQLVHTEKLPAARGSIFDRNGVELAMTIRQSTVWANPRVVTDPAGAAAALAPILRVEAADLQARLSKDAAFVYLARTVPDDVARQVEALRVDGVYLMEEPKRFTPAGELGLPVIGRVGIDNTGLGGVELKYEDTLAGTPGLLVVEQDPTGHAIAGGVREQRPSVRGDDLVLTIDRALQYETERALGSKILATGALGGVAVAMHVRTGEVLAMASLVRHDAEVRQAPSNFAVTHVYEPGSVNKLITVGAALEEGLVAPDSTLTVPDHLRVANKTFRDHDPHPAEPWTVTEIMANSSNVGTIMLAQDLGKEQLDHYLRGFGFGAKTALGFPGESPGIMLDPAAYSATSLGTIAIGNGVAVTALQMLAAYNTVANGGVYVAPKLVKAVVGVDGAADPTPVAARRRVVSSRTADQLTSMLTEVVRAGTGTNAAIDGYTVAGKTGTAMKPKEGERGYKAGAYMASFAGFVPAEDPELAMLVMLDEPTPIYGGLVAAPVFAEVARYGLRQLRIPPPPQPEAPAPAVVTPAPGGGSGASEPVDGEEHAMGAATLRGERSPARRDRLFSSTPAT